MNLDNSSENIDNNPELAKESASPSGNESAIEDVAEATGVNPSEDRGETDFSPTEASNQSEVSPPVSEPRSPVVEVIEEGQGEEIETREDATAVIAALQEEVSCLTKNLAQKNEEIEGIKGQYMRLTADFDNFRRRTAKEKEEIQQQVKKKTLSELLSVVDNFERARTQIKPANEGEMAIHKSYQGVYKTLVDSLKKIGVSAMRPEGQPFDPIYHEAMLREPTQEYPEGTVIEQLVRGYLLDGEVLRHAMVKVAASLEGELEATQVEGAEISESPTTE